MRALVTILVRVLVLLLIVRAYLLAPIVITTGSMAPTLRGDHVATTCANCRRPIVWSADAVADDAPGQVLCPICFGKPASDHDLAKVDGDRLLVDRTAFWRAAPKRWDLAVFRDPLSPSRWLIKRVVGLPGETVRLENGDVYSHGARIEKSFEQFASMAIPVYDSETPDGRNTPPCAWRGEPGATAWRRINMTNGTRFTHEEVLPGRDGQPAPFDWLSYHHPSPVEGTSTVLGAGVADDLPYNLQTGRTPLPVFDVVVCFQLRMQGPGRLAIRLPIGGGSEAIVLCDANRARGRLLVDGRQVANEFPFVVPGGGQVLVAAAHCDGRIHFQIDGLPAFQPRRVTPTGKSMSRPTMVGLGVSNLAVEIAGLRLSRDILYLAPESQPGSPLGPWQCRLAELEYLMLGDNPVTSSDSRSWRPVEIQASELVGRPWLLYRPSRIARLWGAVFQVPDFERIRYIPSPGGE